MRLELLTPPGVTQAGSLTAGSAAVTGLADTSLLAPGQRVRARGYVPSGALVLSVDSDTQVTLTQTAKRSGAADLAFAVEPLSLADAKLHLRVDIPDDDGLIANYIASARRYAEKSLKQALLTQTWRLYLDGFPSAGGYYNRELREVWPSLGGLPAGVGFAPGMVPNSTGVIKIPLPPVQAVLSVQYLDFANALRTVDPSAYSVGLGTVSRIQPYYSHVWPLARPGIDAVRVDFRCGYGDGPDDVPENVIDAIKLLVGAWYANREAVAPWALLPVPMGVDSLLGASEHGAYA